MATGGVLGMLFEKAGVWIPEKASRGTGDLGDIDCRRSICPSYGISTGVWGKSQPAIESLLPLLQIFLDSTTFALCASRILTRGQDGEAVRRFLRSAFLGGIQRAQ